MKITAYNFNYANFIPKPDRRQQNVSVDVERRSGVDRRQVPRYILANGESIPGIDPNTQFVQQVDRRQRDVFVSSERRSGPDRRQEARFIPLSFGDSNKAENKINTIFIGKILTQGSPATDLRPDVEINSKSKLNQPALDMFVHLGKSKDISATLKPIVPKKATKFSEIKQNIINFLSDSNSTLKKTAEVFGAITTIVVGTESIKKLVSSLTKSQKT